MALRIVTEVPRRFRGRSLLRVLAVLVGVVLVVVALLAGAVAVVLLALFVTTQDASVDLSAVAALAVTGGIALVGMLLGLRLLRGRRRLVLFLRRFRLAEATEAVTVALATAMGRSWRVVTLDDAETPPVGVPTSIRRSLALTAVLGVAVLAAALAWFAASGGLEGLLDRALSDALDDVMAPAEEDAGLGEALEALFAGLLVAIFITMAVGVVVMLFVGIFLVVAVFFGFTGLFMTTAYVRARRADRRKRAIVATPGEIEAIARKLPRQSSRVMGSRLTVLTVAPPIWQDAVRALAAAVPVVLIDVSQPSQNVLWEIETLRRDAAARWVLIGDLSRLETLRVQPADPGPADPMARQLAALLDGETVLAYRSGRRAMRRFARSLRVCLDGAV